MKRILSLIAMSIMTLTAMADEAKAPVFITAGQSNADGRVYNTELPDYLDNGYRYLHFANVTSSSTGLFSQRTFEPGGRWAFCDVTNYYLEQALGRDFYAVKCTYGGTAIAPDVTAAKLPVWYADAEWLKEHNAYRGQDITQEAYKNNNSLAKSLTEGFRDLAATTLSQIAQGYDVKAIMWHQGESDRNAADRYYVNFKTLISYLRQAIYDVTGDEADLTLPFIFGTISHSSTQYNATVEKAQLQVAKDVENVYYIDMSDAGLRSDNLHFDAAWTEYLGRRMYNKLIELQLVSGQALDIQKPKTDSNTDIEVQAERSWDFTRPWSDESKSKLEADDSWAALSQWGYRYSGSWQTPTELQTSTGYKFPETEGLFFKANANRATINPGKNIGLYAGGIYLIVPKVKPGQYITIESVTAKSSAERGVTYDTMYEQYLDCIQGGVASYKQQKNVWWYRDTFTEPQDMYFCIIGGGVFITKVMVSDASPIAVNAIRQQGAGGSSSANQHYYDLQGRSYSHLPTASGIYINEGHKFLVANQ
ncbi:MAG: hypothetical protein IJV45_03455 [Prevotella sp.]|nr:hypothetical protein [Prevotella sp.]